jgi:hypothetical protein
VFFGAGNGGFNPGPTINTGQSPRHASIADVNGDSHPDLVVANRDSSTLSILLGDGAGTFGEPSQLWRCVRDRSRPKSATLIAMATLICHRRT